jgi:hypothetical protein
MPRCVLVAGIAITAFDATVADAFENVTGGIATDYQPSVIRSRDDGARIVVFERLDAAQSGDLWLTRSADDGASWSEPVAIVATDANERHPALLQLGPSNYVLFYLSGTGATSSFRIARATSSDGIAFDAHGAIDLGWTTGGEINPHVIRHADGRLTMSYQRLGTGAYVAESLDGGVTWDTRRTSIAAGAALPRIAFRDSDGLYLASYQVNPGDNALHVFVKTTHDVTDWSAAAADFAVEGNHHDSLPVVMPDDAFAVFWIRASGNAFDIAVRRSRDGFVWSAPLAVTASPGADDVEPHPLVGASATDVELYWGRAAVAGTLDYDIVREAHVVVDDGVFVDGFDPAG